MKNNGQPGKYYWLRLTKVARYRRHYQFAVKSMKMLYTFLSLFTSQFVLASSFMTRKEQTKNRVKSLASEITITASFICITINTYSVAKVFMSQCQ